MRSRERGALPSLEHGHCFYTAQMFLATVAEINIATPQFDVPHRTSWSGYQCIIRNDPKAQLDLVPITLGGQGAYRVSEGAASIA